MKKAVLKHGNKENEWTEEEKQNVVGVFKILLDVDKRINPQNYKLISKQPVK